MAKSKSKKTTTPESRRVWYRTWAAANPEKIKEYQRRYRIKMGKSVGKKKVVRETKIEVTSDPFN